MYLSLPAEKENICVARYAAGVVANSMGFDFEKIEDIKLVVGEACNNSVLHCDNKNNLIRICISKEKDSLVIKIRDHGYGFDLENYKEPKIGKLEEGGFGIYIMKSLSDELIFLKDDEPGTVLYIKFLLK